MYYAIESVKPAYKIVLQADLTDRFLTEPRGLPPTGCLFFFSFEATILTQAFYLVFSSFSFYPWPYADRVTGWFMLILFYNSILSCDLQLAELA